MSKIIYLFQFVENKKRYYGENVGKFNNMLENFICFLQKLLIKKLKMSNSQ